MSRHARIRDHANALRHKAGEIDERLGHDVKAERDGVEEQRDGGLIEAKILPRRNRAEEALQAKPCQLRKRRHFGCCDVASRNKATQEHDDYEPSRDDACRNGHYRYLKETVKAGHERSEYGNAVERRGSDAQDVECPEAPLALEKRQAVSLSEKRGDKNCRDKARRNHTRRLAGEHRHKRTEHDGNADRRLEERRHD